jgi:hypothetical protein
MAAQHTVNCCCIAIQSLEKRGQGVSDSEASIKPCTSFARMPRVPIDPGHSLRTRRFDRRRCQLGGGHPACLLSDPGHSNDIPRQWPL